MGSGRWSLAGVVLLVLASMTLPVAAADDEIPVHGIEAAAVATLVAAVEVTAPWQPLFADVEEVTEGRNPISAVGVLAVRIEGSVTDLSLTLPNSSPVETIQTGSTAFYDGQDVITFALIQSLLPADRVEGEAVEFAFYWRWAGLPTQPADPAANGDATQDATNSFAIGTSGGDPYTVFTQSDGTSMIEFDTSSVAAWEFVADGQYNLLIAIPGVPEAVWGSALNAQTVADAADFGIQITSEVSDFAREPTLTLSEESRLADSDQAASWLRMKADGRSVDDLLGTDTETVPQPDQVDAGAALPPDPPVEVDQAGRVVDPAGQDTSGTLWRWIVGIFLGVAVVTMLIWILVFRPNGPAVATTPQGGDRVEPEESEILGRRGPARGDEDIDGLVVKPERDAVLGRRDDSGDRRGGPR